MTVPGRIIVCCCCDSRHLHYFDMTVVVNMTVTLTVPVPMYGCLLKKSNIAYDNDRSPFVITIICDLVTMTFDQVVCL